MEKRLDAEKALEVSEETAVTEEEKVEELKDPEIDRETQVMLMGMLLLTYFPLTPEINLTFFGVSIIYIGSIQSLETYKLQREGEEPEERGFFEGLLARAQTVWMFPIISSFTLLIAFFSIKY